MRHGAVRDNIFDLNSDCLRFKHTYNDRQAAVAQFFSKYQRKRAGL
jgi:hypothetical protein